MEESSLEKVKIKFEKVYANLPDKIRNEDIILIMDKKTYTWNAVYFEVKNETKLGMKMLKKLKELEII